MRCRGTRAVGYSPNRGRHRPLRWPCGCPKQAISRGRNRVRSLAPSSKRLVIAGSHGSTHTCRRHTANPLNCGARNPSRIGSSLQREVHNSLLSIGVELRLRISLRQPRPLQFPKLLWYPLMRELRDERDEESAALDLLVGPNGPRHHHRATRSGRTRPQCQCRLACSDSAKAVIRESGATRIVAPHRRSRDRGRCQPALPLRAAGDRQVQPRPLSG